MLSTNVVALVQRGTQEKSLQKINLDWNEDYKRHGMLTALLDYEGYIISVGVRPVHDGTSSYYMDLFMKIFGKM